MSEFSYIKLNHYMLKRPRLSKTLVFLCKAITLAFYILYPIFLITAFIKFGFSMYMLAVVPFVSLVVLSLLRAKLNFKRPYELFDITPLYNKKTKGNSFPSRHTFAVFIITFTLYYFVSPAVFSVLLILSFALAALRVILGVHLIRDVLAGFLFALISAVIGYVLM